MSNRTFATQPPLHRVTWKEDRLHKHTLKHIIHTDGKVKQRERGEERLNLLEDRDPDPTCGMRHRQRDRGPRASGQANTVAYTTWSPGRLLAVRCLILTSYNQILFLYFLSSLLFPRQSTPSPFCSLWPWPSGRFFFFPSARLKIHPHVAWQCAAVQTH